MINLVFLKSFCTLVEVGHFTQTAEKLFMTQSGVSQHIKKLEQQLGTLLLVREGKSFHLTDAGMKLYTQGLDLLKTTEALETLVKRDEALIGNVKIASPGSIGLKLYPYLLDIQQQYSQLVFDYMFAPNAQIEKDLEQQKYDFGLVTELSQNSKLTYVPITSEPLVLVTSALVKKVNWQTLLSLGFVGHPDGAFHANSLLSQNFDEFEDVRQFPHQGFSNQIGLILEPICRGIGFTVLPLHAVKAFNKQENIRVHHLTKTVNETLYLCVNKQTFETQRVKYVKSQIISFLMN